MTEESERKSGGKFTSKIVYQKDQLAYIAQGSFGPVGFNIFLFIILHVFYAFGIYWIFIHSPHVLDIKTQVWSFSIAIFSGLGVTAGAHRLWSHKSYKAKLPLRLFLALGQTMAGQNSIYVWARDHRLHHKFSDSDADPHNINRGLFFSHCGWLLYRKHPSIHIEGAKLDMSDLRRDIVVTTQEIYYYPLFILFGIVIPISIPVILWKETFLSSFLAAFIVRIMTVTHSALMINSVNHRVGEKPYNSSIRPGDNNFVSVMLLGEGYHNFHHVFPFDFAASELKYNFNSTKFFIQFMAKIGQAYDLKRATEWTIQRVKEKVSLQKLGKKSHVFAALENNV